MSSQFIFHCMSGLPRSGSTLLAAILRQNPSVQHAGITSPVLPMIVKISSIMVEGELATEFNETQRKNLIHGIINNYYLNKNSAPIKNIIFDNHRMWCTRLNLLDYIHPYSRVICCVRDPVWIINSFERIIQSDPLLGSRLIPIEHRGTLHERVEALLSSGGAFGYCWKAIREAFYSKFARKLIIVDYDTLTKRPKETLMRLESILGIKHHTYNLNNITFNDANKFDENLNTIGLHSVGKHIHSPSRRIILPPDIVSRLAGCMFWRDPSENRENADIICDT
ncbi:sulfotransferase [Komagataeibacter saccharivorans]|uniref:sulfotransferase n=1 Tax=Komagataeibacter saccharivorans TaxID=265959 RepID=UPI000C832555|nr:sulfotransferase [Komagataeibacter saccharivorans]